MKKQTTYILFVMSLLLYTSAWGQNDSTWKARPEIAIAGFADVFYAYDFNQPPGTARQSFLFNHNRHNEFNLNLALIQFDIDHAKYRANIGLQTGVYANDNYVAEPGLLKNIYEAYIGVALNKKNNLWLDVGIFPSHIGFESAISSDNLTLTRSLLAENSPYFLSGAKLTYQAGDKWDIVGIIANGWQRIQRLEGNSMLSFGTQVNFRPTENITLNWSTFVGTDDPDISRRMRYFNNLFGQFKVSESLEVIAGVDHGVQQRTKGSSNYDAWLSPIIIARYNVSDTWKIGVRAEYYQDKTGITIPLDSANEFQTTGLSLNLDYLPVEHLIWRIEGRWLSNKDDIFETVSNLTNKNFSITTSLAIKLSEI